MILVLINIHLLLNKNNFVSIELQWYCDASKTTYSAVIYARTLFKDKMTVKFVSAKSEVVSNKGLSIVIIELAANIYLGVDVLKTFSRRFIDAFSASVFCLTRRLGRRKIVTLHYDKNRQLLFDLLRFWLCSTSLLHEKTPYIFAICY